MDDQKTVRIRERAYQLFMKRGEHEGSPTQDWLQAEAEIRQEENRHRGPARIQNTAHHGHLTNEDGCDVENPT